MDGLLEKIDEDDRDMYSKFSDSAYGGGVGSNHRRRSQAALSDGTSILNQLLEVDNVSHNHSLGGLQEIPGGGGGPISDFNDQSYHQHYHQ